MNPVRRGTTKRLPEGEKRARRRISVLAALALLALAFGVAAGTASRTATPTPATLTGDAVGSITASNVPPFQILTANFLRVYPKVNLVATPVNGSLQIQQILTQFQAGNPPDWFGTNPANSNAIAVWPMAAAGDLQDLSGSPWIKRIPKGALDSVSYKGKVYGLPLSILPVGGIYNIDLLKQLKIAIPQTTADVIKMCKTAKAAGKYAFALSMQVASGPSIASWADYVEAAFVYNKDPNFDTERAAHKVTFAGSQLWKNGLYWLLQMNKAGCFNPSPQGTSQNDVWSMMASGKALAIAGFTVNMPSITALNPNIHLGMFTLPAQKASDSLIPYTDAPVLVASKAAKSPDAVKAWIDFMGRPAQAALFAKISSSLSTFQALKGETPSFMDAGMTANFKAGKTLVVPSNGWPNPNMGFAGLYTGEIGLFTGQLTIDKVLANLDYLWDNPTATSAP